MADSNPNLRQFQIYYKVEGPIGRSCFQDFAGHEAFYNSRISGNVNGLGNGCCSETSKGHEHEVEVIVLTFSRKEAIIAAQKAMKQVWTKGRRFLGISEYTPDSLGQATGLSTGVTYMGET
jgi:hypothetical protein